MERNERFVQKFGKLRTIETNVGEQTVENRGIHDTVDMLSMSNDTEKQDNSRKPNGNIERKAEKKQ